MRSEAKPVPFLNLGSSTRHNEKARGNEVASGEKKREYRLSYFAMEEKDRQDRAANHKLSTMTTKPLTAYQWYCKYTTKLRSLPSEETDDPSIIDDREAYKSYIIWVLNESSASSGHDRSSQPTFHGYGCFPEMSKQIGLQWRQSEDRTKSVFHQLAREDKARYDKELFGSYALARKKHFSSVCNESRPTSDFDTPMALSSSVDLANQVGTACNKRKRTALTSERICVKLYGVLSLISRNEGDVSDEELRQFLSTLNWSRLYDEDKQL